MANLPGAGTKQNTYDAIVPLAPASAAAGAAKELTEKGLKTLVLERGRDVKHGEYPTAMMESWQFEGRNKLSNADAASSSSRRAPATRRTRPRPIGL